MPHAASPINSEAIVIRASARGVLPAVEAADAPSQQPEEERRR